MAEDDETAEAFLVLLSAHTEKRARLLELLSLGARFVGDSLAMVLHHEERGPRGKYKPPSDIRESFFENNIMADRDNVRYWLRMTHTHLNNLVDVLESRQPKQGKKRGRPCRIQM